MLLLYVVDWIVPVFYILFRIQECVLKIILLPSSIRSKFNSSLHCTHKVIATNSFYVNTISLDFLDWFIRWARISSDVTQQGSKFDYTEEHLEKLGCMHAIICVRLSNWSCSLFSQKFAHFGITIYFACRFG